MWSDVVIGNIPILEMNAPLEIRSKSIDRIRAAKKFQCVQ